MSSSDFESVRICPDCGADNAAAALRCWMCYLDIRDEHPVVEAQLATPSTAAPVNKPPPFALSELFFRLATVCVLVMLVLVGIGVATEEAGLGIVYVIMVTPPLLGTLLRVRKRRSKVGNVTWSEKFMTLMVSGAIMLGVIGLLWIAAIVALLAFCFVALAGGGL